MAIKLPEHTHFLQSFWKGASINDVRILGEGGGPCKLDFGNERSVDTIRIKGSMDVKSTPNFDIIYG